jgi:hypothetical protein
MEPASGDDQKCAKFCPLLKQSRTETPRMGAQHHNIITPKHIAAPLYLFQIEF